MDSKTCTVCKQIKPISEFRNDISRKDRHGHRCRVCDNKKSSEWHIKNKEKASATNKKYNYSYRGIWMTLVHVEIRRKHTREIINFEDFCKWYSQEHVCHYCGIKENELLTYYPHLPFRYHRRLSIDRKDNSIGYVMSNMVLACFPCNRTKSDMFTESEMLEIAARYITPKRKIIEPRPSGEILRGGLNTLARSSQEK